ncbi:hypothetical protein TNIN_17551 [Trichonephila inaurata madagascariensis]|uniref:Uncharacterized protein n=1 Tax=Trichonephila inaurata madagascariensis TaxID=2747483 RepID=A0A8X6JRY9_9ARAC|nr:hypothetical protein TNIN_17551 [Trichonephila inaurata madagascariensis]
MLSALKYVAFWPGNLAKTCSLIFRESLFLGHKIEFPDRFSVSETDDTIISSTMDSLTTHILRVFPQYLLLIGSHSSTFRCRDAEANLQNPVHGVRFSYS